MLSFVKVTVSGKGSRAGSMIHIAWLEDEQHKSAGAPTRAFGQISMVNI